MPPTRYNLGCRRGAIFSHEAGVMREKGGTWKGPESAFSRLALLARFALAFASLKRHKNNACCAGKVGKVISVHYVLMLITLSGYNKRYPFVPQRALEILISNKFCAAYVQAG